jgi:hypothetical protein
VFVDSDELPWVFLLFDFLNSGVHICLEWQIKVHDPTVAAQFYKKFINSCVFVDVDG